MTKHEQAYICKAVSKQTRQIIKGYPFKWQDKAYLICGMVDGEPYKIEVYPDTICKYICTDKAGTSLFERDIAIINGTKYIACYNPVFNKFEWRNKANLRDYPIDILSDCVYNIVDSSINHML